ncbi:hypothetical protein AB1Y20_013481 [Prymnesium parvum]|uniref:Uncharacterized protein n=1 Tax=Prymnesium parvum TaxID=97485 RepID=A0AB34IGR4_PRYPA
MVLANAMASASHRTAPPRLLHVRTGSSSDNIAHAVSNRLVSVRSPREPSRRGPSPKRFERPNAPPAVKVSHSPSPVRGSRERRASRAEPRGDEQQVAEEKPSSTSTSPNSKEKARRWQQLLDCASITKGTFRKEAELREWLRYHHVNISQWGQGKAKSVAELFAEVESKEATLQVLSGRVFRCVKVVKLVARRPEDTKRSSHLVQVAQTLPDGRVKSDLVLPSGKLLDGETPLFASMRAAKIELGDPLNLTLEQIFPDKSSLLAWNEVADSPAFPSLRTKYRLYQLEVIVEGIPATSFVTRKGKRSNGYKQQFFEWREDSPFDLLRRRQEGDKSFEEIEDEGNPKYGPWVPQSVAKENGWTVMPGPMHPSHSFMWHVLGEH